MLEVEELDAPYNEIILASQYVSSYFDGTLQKSASKAVENKLDELSKQYKS